MKSKRRNIIIATIFVILIILVLWIIGIIPKQIAKISSTVYLKNNFPKTQLKYEGIEWNKYFGDYIITYRDENNELHTFCIGPKYFPVNLGQGIFGFKESYIEKYEKTKGTTKQKYRDLEDVELDYDFAQMVEDKCYIVMDSGVVYHADKLDNFIRNVENNIADEIRIVGYSIEEQLILTNLEYKDNKFILKFDNRRDRYASPEDKKITKTEYDAEEYKLVKGNTPNNITDLKIYYSLDLKSTKTNETIPISSYVEIKKTSNEKFEIQFSKNINNEGITKIVDKEESNKYDYNIYSYKGTVDILINGEKMSLRDALLNDKITIEEILEKAQKDAKVDRTIFGGVYADGGSKNYIYNDYQILKLNQESVVENDITYIRDLYIGVPSMNINDIKKLQDEENKKNINNKVTTIDITTTGLSSVTPMKKYTLNQKEIYEIFNIIDNLQFSKETCDGLPSYIIKYNSKDTEGFITYGIEMYNGIYHITAGEKGEAILSIEQTEILEKILNKYFI